MKRVWAIVTIRPLLEDERIDAMLLGLSCVCGADVTHDTTRRIWVGNRLQETGMKVCPTCVNPLVDDLVFSSTKYVFGRKSGAK